MPLNLKNSEIAFQKSKNLIPGGVNSPVRAFKSVGGTPIFMSHASGAYLYDLDGNQYIDLIGSWGPMLLGHAHPDIEKAISESIKKSFSFGTPTLNETIMAELIIQMMPSIEMVRMVNSGTEACMSAIRVARGYTGKSKIIKFEGCYHGHADSFLVAAGSGAATFGVPDSLGVTQGVAKDTFTVPFNDIVKLEHIIEANHNDIAAIIVEPVVGNMGCVPPQDGFLHSLRNLCDKYAIVLIFDEVMTGFRLSRGGAQGLYGVTPDLTTLGKIIGGGLPVGAYGGKRDIMSCVSPNGKVYQAGTLSGNPISMAAGIAMLKYIYENPSIYDDLNSTTSYMVENIKKAAPQYTINQVGSMYSLFFTTHKVVNFDSAKTSDTDMFSKYFHLMLEEGVYLAPSQFESLFVSTAITKTIADQVIEKHQKVMRKLV